MMRSTTSGLQLLIAACHGTTALLDRPSTRSKIERNLATVEEGPLRALVPVLAILFLLQAFRLMAAAPHQNLWAIAD